MSAAPRFSMTTAAVDDADAVRDASQLTEAALSCWGHADAEGAADFEQVLRVLGGVSIHVSDPRQVHLTERALASALRFRVHGDLWSPAAYLHKNCTPTLAFRAGLKSDSPESCSAD